MRQKDTTGRELLTLPQIHRRYGLGLRTLRRAAASGAFPLYMAGTTWPRARREEFEAWLESTRTVKSEKSESGN